jgi:hypothetical protein
MSAYGNCAKSALVGLKSCQALVAVWRLATRRYDQTGAHYSSFEVFAIRHSERTAVKSTGSVRSHVLSIMTVDLK